MTVILGRGFVTGVVNADARWQPFCVGDAADVNRRGELHMKDAIGNPCGVCRCGDGRAVDHAVPGGFR